VKAHAEPYTQALAPSAPWARVLALIYDHFLYLGEVAGMRAARKTLFEGATGRVVEIGAGTGSNVAHYGPDVPELILVEPEPAMRRRLERRVRRSGRQAVIVDAAAEQLPLADGSVKPSCPLSCFAPSSSLTGRSGHRTCAAAGRAALVHRARAAPNRRHSPGGRTFS
jgi:SAM-dependent methyltransferase